jgi:tetratricopeptide (TPR) repeat protein
MDYGPMAVIHEIVDQVEACGNSTHSIAVLNATAALDKGIKIFRAGEPRDAIKLHEEALRGIADVPMTEPLQGLLQGAMIAEYFSIGDVDRAISIGTRALRPLATDPRLALPYAICNMDLGGAYVHVGKLDQGLNLMERAMAICETLPEASKQAAICLKNLQQARAALQQRQSRSTWLSRLLGRRTYKKK